MEYYDDDDGYYGDYYEYGDHIEPVSLTVEDFSEKILTDVLSSAGLISELTPWFNGTMEKLVFMHGDRNEVYSSEEILFIEHVKDVVVYPDYNKTLSRGNMTCRAIAAKFECNGVDALKDCISFEKIIDKAFDGYNIFLFVTRDSVFLGCRLFNKQGQQDCALSKPIHDQKLFEQTLDELTYLIGVNTFIEFYNQFIYVITAGQEYSESYEDSMMRRRGIQLSYLDEIGKIEQEMGVSLSGERERYWRMFYEKPEEAFSDLIDDVCEGLSFIKSNRVNTYEILFEADEMMRQAEQAAAENERLAQVAAVEFHKKNDTESDEEAQALLDDPEEMIKLLKKRRGL